LASLCFPEISIFNLFFLSGVAEAGLAGVGDLAETLATTEDEIRLKIFGSKMWIE